MIFPPPTILSLQCWNGQNRWRIAEQGRECHHGSGSGFSDCDDSTNGRNVSRCIKNVKSGNDNHDFTAGVKVEVPRLKDDCHAKVLEHIQLVISTATLRGFGHAFDDVIAHDLPVYHSNRDKFDLSVPNELKMFNVVQANNNAMAWLRMAFPLSKHQHEIDAVCTTNFLQGAAREAIRRLKARVIAAKEMAATVLQAELDAIKMKATEDPQAIDDKFNELAILYIASGSTLTAAMKKTQLIKIMPSLYSGCINMANQVAQGNATANVFNDLIAKINAMPEGASTMAAFTVTPIDMDSIECSYEQLQHTMQVRFQQLCISQPGKFNKDGVGGNKGNCNGNKVSLGNVEFKGTCYHCSKQGHKASNCPDKKNGGSNNQQTGSSNQQGA